MSIFDISPWSWTQVKEVIRLTLSPSHLAIQLPESASPITTPIPTANTETKILGAAQLTLVEATDFTYDSGNDRFFFSRTGAVNVPFVFSASQSFSQAASVAEVIVRLRVNGVAHGEIFAKRTISSANTVGVIALFGHLTLSENDYLDLSFESNKTGDLNAWSFASDLKEEGEL